MYDNYRQHLAACEIEARRRVKFTVGNYDVATIDQVYSAYYEAVGDPFMAAGNVGLICAPSPYSRRHSPHHHRISCRAVDLVEEQ